MHFKIAYTTAYYKGQLKPTFDTPDDALAYLDKHYKVIDWEEDQDFPHYFNVAVQKGPQPVYSIEPIVEVVA